MKRILATICLAVLATTPAVGQTRFPERPVTIIVPFSPGGITDTAARVAGEGLSALWGQQVVVVNQTGGSGFIAAQAAKQAAPDGYTLLASEAGVAIINHLIFKETPYDMETDFIPISTISDAPIAVAAHVDSGIETMADLLQRAKDETVNYSSPADGTLNHLTGEWLAAEAGIKLRHIGYRGGGPAAVALASNEVPVGVLSLSSLRPYVEQGKVRILAIAEADRVAAAPDIPTLQESGVPNVDTTQWTGLFAPAGTPPEIVAQIASDLATVLSDGPSAQRLMDGGSTAKPVSPETFASDLAAERKVLADIVAKSGIEPR